MSVSLVCPCGSGQALDDCCGPFLDGGATPESAENLMRSRYSAYVLGQEDYLLATWHPDFRPRQLALAADQRWLGLKINATTGGLAKDTTGTVEFVARYKVDGRGHRLHENSRFVREDGRWYYTDGDLLAK